MPGLRRHGFDLKPRVGISRNIFCKACDQGFNVSPDPPKVYFVRALAAGRAREPRLSRLARQSLPVLFRRSAEPVKFGDPGFMPTTTSNPGGGDQIGRAGGGAKHIARYRASRRSDCRATPWLIAPVISAAFWPRSTTNRRFRC